MKLLVLVLVILVVSVTVMVFLRKKKEAHLDLSHVFPLKDEIDFKENEVAKKESQLEVAPKKMLVIKNKDVKIAPKKDKQLAPKKEVIPTQAAKSSKPKSKSKAKKDVNQKVK